MFPPPAPSGQHSRCAPLPDPSELPLVSGTTSPLVPPNETSALLKSFARARKSITSLRRADTNLSITLARGAYYRIQGKKILAHQRATIKGLSNIKTIGRLSLGVHEMKLMHRTDTTLLDVEGKLSVMGNFIIGRGCRMHIGPQAVCELGTGYCTAASRFFIMHRLHIGNGVAIAWDCEFIDDDFHQLDYDGRVETTSNGIVIRDKVWIGSHVKVLKNVEIARGCVVAANSVVTKSCLEENALIAGSPARVIRRNVTWN